MVKGTPPGQQLGFTYLRSTWGDWKPLVRLPGSKFPPYRDISATQPNGVQNLFNSISQIRYLGLGDLPKVMQNVREKQSMTPRRGQTPRKPALLYCCSQGGVQVSGLGLGPSSGLRSTGSP